MHCVECDEQLHKYKCPRCNNYCCSFDCFKTHKTAECTPVEPTSANEPSTENAQSKRVYHFTTEDTVDVEKLDKLGECEPLKELLQNKHLQDFLSKLDAAPNAWKAMQYAMHEPLFVEFANECLKVVEPNDDNELKGDS